MKTRDINKNINKTMTAKRGPYMVKLGNTQNIIN